MRRLFCLVVVLAALAVGPLLSSCGNTTSSQQPGTAGLAPGTPCGTSVAGNAETNCLANPRVPGCYLCVTFPNDASAPLCEYACHVNMSECPPGHTCILAGGYASTGCIAADLGYCN